MKKSVLMLIVSGLFLTHLSANAQDEVATDSKWMARVRALYIDPANHSSPVSGVEAGEVAIPELDFSYFITPNWSLELILGTSKHDVMLNSAGLGTVSLLPPTLTAQYHFTDLQGWKPYVGVGVNYTIFYDKSLSSGLDVSDSSTGLALQAGFDVKIADNLYVNVDVKKVYIKTDVSSNGSYLTTFDIDPILLGFGLGMRF
ncbi:MAG: OmpW family outer membrane protein [Bdellovibrio sp.]